MFINLRYIPSRNFLLSLYVILLFSHYNSFIHTTLFLVKKENLIKYILINAEMDMGKGFFLHHEMEIPRCRHAGVYVQV
jgi:hypothetical protein